MPELSLSFTEQGITIHGFTADGLSCRLNLTPQQIPLLREAINHLYHLEPYLDCASRRVQ